MPPLHTTLADDFVAFVRRTRPNAHVGAARPPTPVELAEFSRLLAAARAWRPNPTAFRSLCGTIRRLDHQVESWEDRNLLVRHHLSFFFTEVF